MPRLHGKKHRLALGHRVRRHLADHERAATPVDVVLGEVPLEYPTPDGGRPHVQGSGRAPAGEPHVNGPYRQQSFRAHAAAMSGAVHDVAAGCLQRHEPVALEIGSVPAPASSTRSQPGTCEVEVPRIWRTASRLLFSPWMNASES